MNGTIGEIRLFAGNFAPQNWAFCSGQLLAINSNQALFSILGTTFGGDGVTTFKLPDSRGRGVVSPGTGPGLPTYVQGSIDGAEYRYILTNNMPVHSHDGTLHVSRETGDALSPSGNFIAATEEVELFQSSSNGTMGQNAQTVGNTGGGQPIYNRQPFIGINYIVCLLGIYPSRN